MRFSWKIFRYLIRTVLPYFISSWLLLSVVLFVQQASRFSDIFFSINIPSNLIWQLSFALVPSVIAFTCPMAALVGVIIGLTKMQSDSELVAIRAAGVGNFGISLPILALGIVLSLFAFFVNLKGVPAAAGIVRQVALQTALYKLESPIEPGAFNSEVAGFTIYVREGDVERGTWKDIFIYGDDPKTKTVRLITSAGGRIDYTNENSELVLENATATTISNVDGVEKFYSESIGDVRYAIRTKRNDLVDRMNSGDLSPDELGLAELSAYARSRDGSERTEAELLWHRRIMLSVSPLIFCFFGTLLVLRYNRKSRGFAISSALLSLIVFYLLAFLGEQLARTGKISVVAGSLVPIVVSSVAIAWLMITARFNIASRVKRDLFQAPAKWKPDLKKLPKADLFVDLTAGLRDFDIFLSLSKFYLLSLGFLGSVFIIFTAFELWRFAGSIDNGIWLLLKYLFFLAPFIYLQLAPSSVMIATLATYVVKSRQNEIVTWASAGQSVYRLLLPCVLFTIVIGFANWEIQERLLPRANQMQDELRARIRRGGKPANQSQWVWSATDKRIYSFVSADIASDNENRPAKFCPPDCAAKDLNIYEFTDDRAKLQSVYRIPYAVWEQGRIVSPGVSEKLDLTNGRVFKTKSDAVEIEEVSNPFAGVRNKPNHLDSKEIKERIANSDSDAERRSFAIALEKKYATPFLPFIIALFTAPFALSLSKTGKAATTGYAVGYWLTFLAVTSVFEQLGLSDTLPAALAVWGPLFLFVTLGVFMLSRVRT
ncbi:MAG TPA: LptF/LptG family permease [Pyrinomonadaceae bacterium]|nr:LptF/LptG family permease [Pyrinomonadaceae bacterium]